MPRPEAGESKSEFITRYVESAEAKAKFPSKDQRLAVAESLWSEKSKHSLDADCCEVGVPLLDAHADYSPEFLAEVVENNNRRVADTGDACPIIIGHTTPDGPEVPVIGWAANFRLGEFGALNPRPTILADLCFPDEEKHELAKQYPRRSVELWEKQKYIDAIALLGGTTPARDLGLMFSRKAKGNEQPKRYSLNEAEMEREEILQVVTDAINGNPAIAKLLKVAEMLERDEAESETEAEEKPDQYEKDEQMNDDKTPEVKKDEQDSEKPEKMSKTEQLKLERDDLAIKLSKLESERAAEKTAIADMQRKFRKSEREAELKQLRYEGYAFDLADQVNYCLDMGDAQYEAHKGLIKKCFAKAPLGVGFLPTADLPNPGADGGISKEQMQKAVRLSQEKGISYEAALAQVK